MSKPLEELDYIGLSSEVPSMENSDERKKKAKDLNFKATELRLGLPGSESPEREENGFSVGGLKGLLVSGSKRGFSDTINGGSGKWVFSGNGGSEVELAKNGGLFSPRGVNGGAKILGSESNTQQSAMAMKEAVPHSPRPSQEKKPQVSSAASHGVASAAKAQVVGWPPIRSFRKNSMVLNPPKSEEDEDRKSGCLYVKISMDGAPYLRKVDLKTYNCYKDLTLSLEKMFSGFTIGQSGSQGIPIRAGLSQHRLMDLHDSEYVLTFEDKDGDWMLVGDLPWEMFVDSCKRLRIMKSSDAIGLGKRS